MSPLMIDVVGSIVAMLVGFAIGQIVAWREAKVGGRSFIVPTLHHGEKTPKVAAALVILVAVTSLISGVVTQNQIKRCNEEFRQALTVRSEAAGEVFQAQTDLQIRLAQAPSGDAGDDERYLARQDFVRRMAELQEYRESHPIPEIGCGEAGAD